MSNVLCTISFTPSDATSTELVALNGTLSKKFATNLVSEFQSYRPHITIYQAEFPQKNMEAALTIVEKLAHSKNGISFSPEELNIRGKYVAIAFAKNQTATSFHEQIVEQLNALREENIKDAYKNSLAGFSEKEKENIRKWGYPFVMELYNPHLTILTLANEGDAQEVVKQIRWDKNVVATKIAVVTSSVDEEGVRSKNIQEFLMGA